MLSRWFGGRRRGPAGVTLAPSSLAGVTKSFNDAALLEQIRTALNRTLPGNADLQAYLNIPRPEWAYVGAGEPLFDVIMKQAFIRRHGQLRWAALIQAHNLLFAPGDFNHPVSLAVGIEGFDDDADALLALGSKAFGARRLVGDPGDAGPDWLRLGHVLAAETVRGMGLPIPTGRPDRRALHVATQLVRGQLPFGFLRTRLLPVWWCPPTPKLPTHAVLMVPAAFWPEVLIDP